MPQQPVSGVTTSAPALRRSATSSPLPQSAFWWQCACARSFPRTLGWDPRPPRAGAAAAERFLGAARVRQHLPTHLGLEPAAVQELAERHGRIREAPGASVAAKELVQLVAEYGKAARLEHHHRKSSLELRR